MHPFHCPLYKCKSLNKLQTYLLIKDKSYFKSLSNEIKFTPSNFYHEFTNKDGRDVCACSLTIKRHHKRLIKLFDIEKSDYLKSGVKKQSHITNVHYHEGSNFFLLIDIKSFYPSITKTKIKKQLIITYEQSSKVAEFISNLVTIQQKKSNGKRALVTGSPISQYFAYVINKKMFDELNKLAINENIKFSIYVDDITFSSKTIISYKFLTKVYNILKKYGYTIHQGKIYRGKIGKKSKITGIHITKYGFRLLDKHKQKIRDFLKDDDKQKRLSGLINYAIQVNPKYRKYQTLLKKHGKI